MSYKLGILDQSPIFPGTTAVQAFEHSVQLAQKAEEWGYTRFWVSEHHHMEQVAGSSPEVFISYLLAKTKSIQIGAGGVMIQHYSPYKVVENFHVISSLAPGRVDLGVGKAPGGFPLSTRALQFGTVNDGMDFEERLSFVQQLIEDKVDPDHPLAGIQALPKSSEKPKVFLLGTSENSATIAANYRINYVFAQFINSDPSELESAANVYKKKYPEGKFIVSSAVIAARSQQEAEELAKEHRIFKVHFQSDRTLTVHSAKAAEAFKEQATEPYEIEESQAHVIAGTSEFVKRELDHLHKTYGVDEFILHTPLLKEAERLRSFELLSPLRSSERNREYIL